MRLFISESDVLVSIEELIKNTVKGLLSEQQLLVSLCQLLPIFNEYYRDDFVYSSLINDFIRVKFLIDIMMAEMNSSELEVVILNNIEEIRNALIGNFKNYVAEMQQHRCQEEKNKKKLQEYLSFLFDHYSRLLVIRIDLKYLKFFKKNVTIEIFSKHMETLKNRMSNKDGCFKDLQGFAWAMEQGVDLGYHCHLMLLYDGSKHQDGFGLGRKVEAKWKEITQALGNSFICNDFRYLKRFKHQDNVAIGMILRNDHELVSKAINVGQYLVKPEKENQHLRVKISSKQKTFNTGFYLNSWRRCLSYDYSEKLNYSI